MKSDQRRRISDLYHDALARAPDERLAFLAAASNGDEALREEVESLLACAPAAERFLEQPAANIVASALGRTTFSGVDSDLKRS